MIVSLLFFCLVLQSQASTLVRFAETSSLAICFWRLLFAGGLLLPWALRRKNRMAMRSLAANELKQLALCGFFLFTHFYFFFRSVQETTIANSLILFSINPVFTAIGAYYFFRERLSLHLILSCVLGFAGVAVLFEGSLEASWAAGTTISRGLWGDIWSLASGVCFSGYVLTGKHVRRHLANSSFAAAIYLQTTLYAGLAMLVLGEPFSGYSTQTWWAFLALAIVPTLGGHAIFTYCLNFLNVNFMSCAKLIEPVIAAAVASWLFNEPLTDNAALGFLLTSASVVVLYWDSLRGLIWRAR